jgi:carbon-monoxide dehydrogenase small subunit
MKETIHFVLNGLEVSAEVAPHHSLLTLLREQFDLYGAKEGCGVGECGACTVIVDGLAVNACLLPALEVDGARVETIEGLAAPDGTLHPIQQAFVDLGAIQCGFCTPGMVMSAKALLDHNPSPSEEEIRTAIEGNLCRCTGYHQIVEAIKHAARNLQGTE